MTVKTTRRQTLVRVKRFYASAAYVTPRVALDARHAAALRRAMKRDRLGVSDVIRAAILAYAAPTGGTVGREHARQARPAGNRTSRSARRTPTN